MNAAAAAPPQTTNFRWVICALLFWVTTANYIDRGVFGNLAPDLQARIGWSEGQYWWMTVGFSLAYAFSMLVAGRVIDMMGLRWGFVLAAGLWGLAAMGHSLASTVTGFFVARIVLGLFEGGNFPAANKAVAEWFPKRERALTIGLFNSGSNVGGILVPFGLPLLMPVFAKITVAGHSLGWRGAFLCTGIFDITWIAAWLLVYRRPQEHPRVSPPELALIMSEPPEPTVKIPWRRLLPHRQMWAFATAKVMTDCFWWFYLFGSPYFFHDRFHLDLKARSAPVAIIYVVASVGSVAGGWLAGHFMKLGWAPNRARKTTLFICALGVMPVVFATLTDNQWVAVALITLAASAHQAWSANAFSLASDMFPRRVVGSVTGLGGFIGALGGVVLFVVVAFIRNAAVARGESGDYFPIFLAASVAYLLAVGIVHLLVPRLEVADVEAKPAAA
ncbi:MAG TPA: MFS transporter [Opitutaceae bacterium]|nr:MFS transporter [Opitutaceae bacterium]